MTATRDRRSDPGEDAELAWDDRPILGNFRGLPWWGGVVLAFGLAAIAAVIDMQSQGSLGKIYQGAYLLGCVGAVSLVRRRSLFGPIVQPPLVFAVTAIGAGVVLGDNSGDGLRDLLFSVALPLTSNFPTMAIATGATLAVGAYRLWKERDPNPPVRANSTKDRPTRSPETPRRDRQSKDRVPPAPRKTRGREPEKSRGQDPEKGRARDPEADSRRTRAQEPPEARRTQRGRPPRARGDRRDPAPRERGADRRDRDQGPPERGTGDRPTRARPRDQEPPPRRRDPADPRPRRDDRPAPRREPGDRATPRQPRRRPPDPYR